MKLTTTTVTVIAVEIAAQAHPCLICLRLDDLRNSSVLASIVLYNPNWRIREAVDVTEPSLDMIHVTSLLFVKRALAVSALENVVDSLLDVNVFSF